MRVRDQLSSATQVRMDALQMRINESGIVDMHFTCGDLSKATPEQVAQDMCSFMEAYLDGKCRPAWGYNPLRVHIRYLANRVWRAICRAIAPAGVKGAA